MRAGAGERVSKPLSSTSQRQRGCGQWQNGTEKGRFGGEQVQWPWRRDGCTPPPPPPPPPPGGGRAAPGPPPPPPDGPGGGATPARGQAAGGGAPPPPPPPRSWAVGPRQPRRPCLSDGVSVVLSEAGGWWRGAQRRGWGV
jgi:hypothetical protein